MQSGIVNAWNLEILWNRKMQSRILEGLESLNAEWNH